MSYPCKGNYFDPRCLCINPPNSVINIARNMLVPYYCWYSPCFRTDTIKTADIIAGQANCAISNCIITADQIIMSGGSLTLKNNCTTEERRINVVQPDPVAWPFKLPFQMFRFQIVAVLVLSMVFAYDKSSD